MLSSEIRNRTPKDSMTHGWAIVNLVATEIIGCLSLEVLPAVQIRRNLAADIGGVACLPGFQGLRRLFAESTHPGRCSQSCPRTVWLFHAIRPHVTAVPAIGDSSRINRCRIGSFNPPGVSESGHRRAEFPWSSRWPWRSCRQAGLALSTCQGGTGSSACGIGHLYSKADPGHQRKFRLPRRPIQGRPNRPLIKIISDSPH